MEEGCFADLTIINLDEEREIKGEDFLSKADNTFIGYKVYGNPILTMVEGEVKFKEDK